MSRYTEIFLTLRQRGKYLVRPGVYSEAVIEVKNSFRKDESVKIIHPLKIQLNPKYNYSTRVIRLGRHFIYQALTKPSVPEGINFHRWLRKTAEGKIYEMWDKLNDEQKIKMAVESYADSLGETILEFHLM